MAEVLLPHSVEAERAVLGAVLLEGALYWQAAQHLRASDFYRKGHRELWRAMQVVAEDEATWADGDESPIDVVTIREALERMGADLNDVGGPAYLSALIEGLPRYSNIERYAKIVRSKADLRDVYARARRIETLALQERNIEDIRGELLEASGVGTGDTGAADAARALEAMSEQMLDDNPRKFHTGYPSLARMLDEGALLPGDVMMIAARPSVGKTALAVNLAVRMAQAGSKVYFAALEGTTEKLMRRVLRAKCGWTKAELRDAIRSGIADGEIKGLEGRLWIDDSCGWEAGRMIARARVHAARHGLDVLIVDYLQLLELKGRQENRNLELGRISARLKDLAKSLQVAVVLCCQLRKPQAGAETKKPQLMPWWEDYYSEIERPAQVEFTLFLRKNREGLTGPARLIFNLAQQRILEEDEVEEPGGW